MLFKIIAWFVTLVCFAYTVRCASTFARHATRVFRILALFSLCWAVLFPYYYHPNPPELLVGIAGFLFAYIGVLLQVEARNPSVFLAKFTGSPPAITPPDHSAHHNQAIALWFLPILVIPSAIPVASSLLSPALAAMFPGKDLSNLNSILAPVVPTALLLLGYYGIYKGIMAYSSSNAGKRVMSIILAAYALADSAYTIFAVYWYSTHAAKPPVSEAEFFRTPPDPPMNAFFLLAFSAMKLIFTVMFVWLVLRERMSDEDSRLPRKYLFWKFVGAAIPSPSPAPKPAWIGISREYRGSEKREDIFHESLKLFAVGEQVVGEISRTVDYTSEWKVGGSYHDNVLVLRYWHEDSQRGSGAIVVERDIDSGDFRGCWLGYDRHKKQIGAGPYIIAPCTEAAQTKSTNADWLASPTYFPPVKEAKGIGG
ncbi:MAG TPA: hypothetical protein VJW20_02815 [Candidatus Angelobacter sp.]|nr:hypothetical protein [Candidatus Angelobacter sp.]